MLSARWTALVTLFLTGCSHAPPGIVAVGPHTYTVARSTSVFKGGADVAAQTAFEEAEARCKDDGRLFMPIASEKLSGPASVVTLSNGYSVTFRCAAPDPKQPLDDRPAQ